MNRSSKKNLRPI